MKLINEPYAVLSDPSSRREYDYFLDQIARRQAEAASRAQAEAAAQAQAYADVIDELRKWADNISPEQEQADPPSATPFYTTHVWSLISRSCNGSSGIPCWCRFIAVLVRRTSTRFPKWTIDCRGHEMGQRGETSAKRPVPGFVLEEQTYFRRSQ